MFFSGEKNCKYLIGYMNDDGRIKPFSIIFLKTSTYVKSYDDETKWMYILIADDESLEKYNKTWNKVSTSIKKELNSKPIYNKKFLKTKIKSNSDEATDFHDKEIPKVDSIILA